MPKIRPAVDFGPAWKLVNDFFGETDISIISFAFEPVGDPRFVVLTSESYSCPGPPGSQDFDWKVWIGYIHPSQKALAYHDETRKYNSAAEATRVYLREVNNLMFDADRKILV